MKKVIGIAVALLFITSIIFMGYFGMNIVFIGERNNPVAIEFTQTLRVVSPDGVEREETIYIDQHGVERVNVHAGETIFLSWIITAERPDEPLTDDTVSFIFANDPIFIVNREDGSVFVSLDAWFGSFPITIRTNANTNARATITITPIPIT